MATFVTYWVMVMGIEMGIAPLKDVLIDFRGAVSATPTAPDS